jgi:5'-methylthioadenosine nucleosidase
MTNTTYVAEQVGGAPLVCDGINGGEVRNTATPPIEGESLGLTPQRGPITSVVFTFAMAEEAQQLIEELQLQPYQSTRNPGLHQQYRGTIGAVDVIVSINQVSLKYGVSGVGTTNAAINALCAIEEFKPSLLINAGTAGGFGNSGGAVGDIYLTKETVMYHDRRIPFGAFEPYGNGGHSCLQVHHLPTLLSAKTGVFSTGNSLDCHDADMSRITAAHATVKDMEAAAFAEVAERYNIPFIGIKSITDLVDGHHATAEQFQANFGIATGKLRSALTRLITFLSEGRGLEEL